MSDAILATRPADAGDLIEQVVIQGNLASLTPAQRAHYYGRVCQSLGLNPLTQPFQYITLNGKLVLYARKDATDQLRALRRVSLTITGRETMGDLYVVTARAALPDGRTDEEIGAVPVKGLAGEALANAMMKASTKAKRRVTLSICGLGMLDESEVDSIPDAAPFRDDEPMPIGRAGRLKLEQSEEPIPTTLEPEMMTPHEQEQPPQEGVPGDDVDALTGLELVDACERMRRRLNAAGIEFAALPDPRTNNELRRWWKLGAAALAAPR